MSEGLSVFSSITAMWSTLFGVGMYFTPRAFAKSGVLYASLQLLGVGGISFISILVLFILSYEAIIRQSEIKKEEDNMPSNTYSVSIQDKDLETEVKYVQEKQVVVVKTDDDIRLSYAGLGKSLQKWLGVLIDFMIMMAAFSTVLFFQKFISLISTSLLGHSVVDSIGFNPYYIFVVLYGLIILSGGQFKNLQSIDWLSKISFASIAVNCLIVGAMNFILVDFKSAHITNPTKTVSLSVISTFIFAMFCQNNVVEIFNDIKTKNATNLILVAAAAPLGACVFYAIMGIAGSLLFGDYMPNEDIISILANENSEIVKHLYDTNSKFYCIHFIVPCVAIIGLLISSIYQLSAVTRSLNEKKIFKKIQSKTKKQAVTTFLVICLISSINMFPQIGLSLVFDLIGQFMCNPLAYAFPFLFLAIKCHKNKDYGIKFFGSLIFIIGSVSFAFGGFLYPRLQQDLTLNNSLNMNTTAVSNVTFN